MQRRQVLALLAVSTTGAVAGCGSGDGEPGTTAATATGTRTDTATATATGTETPTETDTPTEAATPTPGGPERAGNEAIAEVEKTLNSAVATYGGPDSDSLLGVDASTTEFRSERVDNSLAEAGEELATARERAVTRDQERTVERLAVALRFLELATDVQIALGNAYFALTQARDDVQREEGADARDHLSTVGNERRIARPILEEIRAETDATAVSVLDTVDTATYETKVAQFGAELGAIGDVVPRTERLSRAVDRLRTARLQESNNSPDAADTASRAADELEAAEAALRDLLDGLSDDADSLRGITTRLAEIAAAKAADARDIAGETPTPTATATATSTN
jgi:hypothetical protein